MNFVDAIIVAAAAVLPYYNSMHGEFVIDDERAVVQNPDVLGSQPIAHLLANDFWGTPLASAASHKSFRPVTVATFRLTWQLFGDTPLPFHIGNMLLYAACCVLFLWFVGTDPCGGGGAHALLKHRASRVFAALLFALHPVHVESVASIVGRADVLSYGFMLLAIASYTKYLQCGSAAGKFTWAAASGLLFLLGTGSKELGILTCVLCAAVDVIGTIRSGVLTRGCFARVAVLAAITAVALFVSRVLRGATMFPAMSYEDNPIHFIKDPVLKAQNYAYIHVWYVLLLLFPYRSCVDWGYNTLPLPDNLLVAVGPAVVLYLVVLAVPLAFVSSAWTVSSRRRQHLNDHARVVVGLVFMVVPFLPASGIVPVGTVLAERLLFMPSGGFAILLGLLFEKIVFLRRLSPTKHTAVTAPPVSRAAPSAHLRLRKGEAATPEAQPAPPVTDEAVTTLSALRTAPFVALLAVCAVLSTQRSSDWNTAESLYQRTVRECPGSAKAWLGGGVVSMQQGKPQAAVHQFEKSLQIFPAYVDALIAMGRVARESGQLDAAVKYLSKALSHDSQSHEALHFLGVSTAQVADTPEKKHKAVAFLERAIKISKAKHLPPNGDLWANYGTALALRGSAADAVSAFRTASSLSGTPSELCHRHKNLVLMLINTKSSQDAERSLLYLSRPVCRISKKELKQYEAQLAKFS
eukprot:Rhum_TRINITY_DN2982_c0_g1::Rhum_TRINITY_DN2982_c0_g1_i1::g.9096::m.9096